MKNTSNTLIDCRKAFEQEFSNADYDLSKGNGGVYRNQDAVNAWEGFQRAWLMQSSEIPVVHAHDENTVWEAINELQHFNPGLYDLAHSALMRLLKREISCTKCDAEMLRVKACEHIAEGDEGWQKLRNECPSTMAVAELRDNYVSAVNSLEKYLGGAHHTALVNNLAMLVRRLANKIKTANFQNDRQIKCVEQAMEFLRCNNLQGSVLRDEIEGGQS